MRELSGLASGAASAHNYKSPDSAGEPDRQRTVTVAEADGAHAERPMLDHTGRRLSGVCPARPAKSALHYDPRSDWKLLGMFAAAGFGSILVSVLVGLALTRG